MTCLRDVTLGNEVRPHVSTQTAPVVASASASSLSAATRTQRRIARTFSANTLGVLVQFAERFLLLPAMLMVWEQEVVGTWYVIRSVPMFLSICEMGFASITGNHMTTAVVHEDWPRARELFWSTSRLINWISLAGLTALLLATMSLSLPEILNCPPQGFKAALLFSAIYTVSIFQTQLMYAACRSIERQAGAVLAINLIKVCELLFALLSLWGGLGLVGVAVVFTSIRLGGIILMQLWLRRRAAWLFESRERSWRTVHELLVPSFGVAGISIAQSIQLQGFTLILSLISSPTTVAAYVALRTLARLPIQLGTTLSRTIWPELSQAIAKCDIAKLRVIQTRVFWISSLAAVASVVLLGVFGEWFYSAWTLGKLPYYQMAFLLMTISGSAISLSLSTVTLQMASSQHLRIAATWTVLMIVSVLLGILIAFSLGDLALTAWFTIIDVVIMLLVLTSARATLHLLGQTLSK